MGDLRMSACQENEREGWTKDTFNIFYFNLISLGLLFD